MGRPKKENQKPALAPFIKDKEMWSVIEDLKINKALIADLAGINAYSFKMKFHGYNQSYRFTELEVEAIRNALCEISGKLNKFCKKKK